MYIFKQYLAEKVQSLGKDWHRPCLKCEKCGKTLSSGGHAEVVMNICHIYHLNFYSVLRISSAHNKEGPPYIKL